MRILAIRGRNLASLAEGFALDLGAEPLAGAGLFAITGETGAGKSTILDAMCLALYGRFPRVQADGSDEDLPDAQGDVIRARDARSILRRGAAAGFAEVDFVGVDGERYRAHWSVYRARGKAAGRLQKVARRIDRLGPDGEAAVTLADQIGSVDARVVELTDLTYDQFGRTVLLAQGDFDAFLRAKDGDRAALLEKITGTDIYARISTRIYEETRDATEAMARVEARLSGVALLPNEEREALEVRRAEVEAAIGVLAGELSELEREGAQAAAIAEAEARLAQAEGVLQAAEADAAAAEPERRRLGDLQRAETLRSIFSGAEAAVRREEAAGRDLGLAEARLAETGPAFAAAESREAETRRIVGSAEAAVRSAEPLWAEAAALDAAIRAVEAALKEAETAATATEAKRKTAEAEVGRIEADGAKLEQTIAALANEVATSAVFEPIAARWEETEEKLGERETARKEWTAASEARQTAEQTIAAATARLAASDEAGKAEAERRREMSGSLDERIAVLAALDVPALRRRDGVLGRVLDLIAPTKPELTRWRAAVADRAQANDDLLRADAAGRDAGDRIGVLERTLAELTARRAGQQGAVDLAEAFMSRAAEELRGHLVDGEPCPVCGGRDHPAAHDPGVAATIARVREERAGLDAALSETERELRGLRTTRTQAEVSAKDAATRKDRAEPIVAQAEASLARLWPDLLAAAAEAELAADVMPPPLDGIIGTPRTTAVGAETPEAGEAGTTPDLRSALDPLETTARRSRAEIGAGFERATVVEGEIAVLRRRLEDLDRANATREAERRAEEAVLGDARTAAAGAIGALDAAGKRLVALDGWLAPRLEPAGLVIADLDRDAMGAVRRLAAAVGELKRLGGLHATKLAERDALAVRLREARLAAGHAAEVADTAAAGAAVCRDKRAGLLADRATKLGGEATEAHRARLLAERDRAVAACAEAATALGTARADQTHATAVHAERLEACGRAASDLAMAVAARDVAAAAAGWTPEEAAGLLAAAATERAPLGQRLAALEEALARARTAVAERRGDRDRLVVTGRPERSREEIGAAVAAMKAQIAERNADLGGLREAIRTDDLAREKAAAFRAEIDAKREAHAAWAAVNDAVGSQNGDKFRRFAQAITLDRLTALANSHLASLNPRYRLSRVGDLGLTVVDRDMGDEIRSTRSLSGGERFLTSLALALALSGLEGRRSFVDTLFIDEGFGSLDAASLDLAIDALESLQGLGRKVGVISHVPAMHERIPVQVRVERAGAGRSRVSVVSGFGAGF